MPNSIKSFTYITEYAPNFLTLTESFTESNFGIYRCMRNKLYHLLATFVMFKWYKLLHYKTMPAIYWMTLV